MLVARISEFLYIPMYASASSHLQLYVSLVYYNTYGPSQDRNKLAKGIEGVGGNETSGKQHK